MEKELHKVGKYGSYETNKDENISKSCAEEILFFLRNKCNINGYTYKIYENGIPEDACYKRDGRTYKEEWGTHKVCTDIPTIILEKDDDKTQFYIVLSGDDKYQETGGNAIERSNKNHRGVFEEKMCFNTDIVPYVIFCSGKSFVNESTNNEIVKNENDLNSYFFSKLREMMPYNFNWDKLHQHSSYKYKWNRLYVKKNRFTIEEKMSILTEVANESYEYYKDKLN